MSSLSSQFKKIAHIRNTEDIFKATRSFSFGQKIAWLCMLLIFFGSALTIVARANEKLLVVVPAYGGTYTEGIIGVPRFVNPVLAASDADRDVTALVYSGLLRTAPDGSLIPDLAERFSAGDDGLSYTFTLKEGLTWHDGMPVTADDIEFTIKRIQDPALKSPRHASWSGIGIERIDERTVRFSLKQPFTGFLENATIGILPKHLWGSVETAVLPFSTQNSEAIGTGPYRIASVSKDANGIPTAYELSAFSNFALGKPYISSLVLRFFGGEEDAAEALQKGGIDGLAALSPEYAPRITRTDLRAEKSPLPRVFAVFFNQNQAELFSMKTVRAALDHALDKKGIVDEIFHGNGTPIAGPIPPGSYGFKPLAAGTSTPLERIAEARAMLEKDGWAPNEETGILEKIEKKGKTVVRRSELHFTLATSDAPDLKRTAELVQKTWASLGATVELKVFERGDLNQTIIRPRKYDALFFGEVLGREPDLFSFWHSSQRNDPGLNVALYANVKADKLIQEARTEIHPDARLALYSSIQEEILRDVPAAFVYSPDFLYLVADRVKKPATASVVTNAERFSNSYQWYIHTEKIWKLFQK